MRLAHGRELVGGEVVHDDDVAGGQRRSEDLLDVGSQGHAIHGAVDRAGRRQTAQAQAGDEGGRLPMPMRHVTHQPLPAQ